VARSTDLILAQLDAADPAFGPSRRAVEVNGGMFGTVVGSQAMRSLAWRLTRARFQDCWQRAIRLVDEHRDSIERLARVLLEGKQTLTGDEIVIAIGEQTTG
jgi:hypothetical protein